MSRTAKDIDLEIMFLRQAQTAQRVREALPDKPVQARPLIHSHACVHCDTTWSCRCIHGSKATYWVKRHGCEEQQAYSKRMAILLSQDDDQDKKGKKHG